MLDLSVILPSIHPERWDAVNESIKNSIGNYSYELIPVGPYVNTSPDITKSVQDYGSPSRALMIGASLAEGRYITWCSDDCKYLPDKLSNCLDVFDKEYGTLYGMVIQYLEGQSFESNEVIAARMGDTYWTTGFHDGTRTEGAKDEWLIAPVGLYPITIFEDYYGIDCVNFEHINLNCIMLIQDIQADNLQVCLSPGHVMRADFDPNNSFIWSCFENDKASYDRLHQLDIGERRVVKKFNSWKRALAKWPKRWGEG